MAKRSGQLQRRARITSASAEKPWNRKLVLIGLMAGLTLAFLVVLALGGGTFVALSFARRCVAARDYQRAHWWISVARRWDGRSGEIEFLAARVARHEQRFAEMSQHLQKAAEFGLDGRRLRREEMLMLAAGGHLDGIEEELLQALRTVAGDEVEISEALSNGLAMVGRDEEARLICDAWRKDFPQDPYPHWRLGRIHAHFRQWDSAEREFRTAIAKDTNCYLAVFSLAQILEDQKRFVEALELYRRCTELPHPVPGKVGMAACLKSMGRIDEAQKLLEEAVDVDASSRIAAYKAVGEMPENFFAATQLGTLYTQIGDYAKAEGCLRRALEANPRDLLARYAFAVALRGLGRVDDAQKQFGIVQTARNALEQVSLLYDRVEANPRDVESLFKLGKTLLDYESERKGLFYLKTVLTYDPGHEPTLRLQDEYQKKSPAERLAALGGVDSLPAPVSLGSTSIRERAGLQQQVRGGQISSVDRSSIHFVDVTHVSGVDFTYHNGREGGANSILESLGGGVGVLDFDGDGSPDLCFSGGGKIGPGQTISARPSSLWRSRGQMRFEEVATAAEIVSSRWYTHGVLTGDYDNDGFPDVLFTGYGGLQLFRNQGDGTFTDVTFAAKLDDKLWSTSGGWGDFNGDGNPDLFVAHYVDWSWSKHPQCAGETPGTIDVCSPREFNGLPDVIYFSNGDGTFQDVSKEVGLDPSGKGLGAVTADVDLDGDLDIYVANDTTNNFLYLNDGHGFFRESGFVSGTAVDQWGIPNGSMGIAVFDYNHDLLPDIWVTNFENETPVLYRNETQASFICVSEGAGITALERHFVGFGTAAGDFDHDGDEDIAVTNGHVMHHLKDGGGQQSLVLSNTGRGRFQNVKFGPESFFSQKHLGRGLIASDLDRDGDLDLVFALANEPAAILANEVNLPQQSVVMRLMGTESNRDAIGARVILHTSRGKFLRLVCGGGSYLSQPEFRLHWGLAAGNSVQGATVYWPSGKVQRVAVDSPGVVVAVERD